MDSPGNEIPPSPRVFHLEMPLYKEVAVTEASSRGIYELLRFDGTIDAYCIYCRKESVFENNSSPYKRGDFKRFEYAAKAESEKYVETSYVCTRNRAHEYTSYFRLGYSAIQKVGQFPSIADLQIPRIQKYRKLLGNEKYREFARAIGLAAHGVGIESFVYLRRVFEGLIEEARSAASRDPEFNEEEYERYRIEERISALKDSLPRFLVQHRSIYGILSKGLHELSEEECLEYYDPIRAGIELILDERIKELDRKKKEKKASEAISKIKGELKANKSN